MFGVWYLSTAADEFIHCEIVAEIVCGGGECRNFVWGQGRHERTKSQWKVWESDQWQRPGTRLHARLLSRSCTHGKHQQRSEGARARAREQRYTVFVTVAMYSSTLVRPRATSTK